jgi:hypothetical protein
MSDPAPTPKQPAASPQSQIEYAAKVADRMVPFVRAVMQSLPPPEGGVAAAVAGWIQALTILQLDFVRTFQIPETELSTALRILADDVDAGFAAEQNKPSSRVNNEPLTDKVDF